MPRYSGFVESTASVTSLHASLIISAAGRWPRPGRVVRRPRPGHGALRAPGRNDEYGRQFLDCLIEPGERPWTETGGDSVSQGDGVAATRRCWRQQAISGPVALGGTAQTARSSDHRRVIEYVDFSLCVYLRLTKQILIDVLKCITKTTVINLKF